MTIICTIFEFCILTIFAHFKNRKSMQKFRKRSSLEWLGSLMVSGNVTIRLLVITVVLVSLCCTVSEISQDIGRKSLILPHLYLVPFVCDPIRISPFALVCQN